MGFASQERTRSRKNNNGISSPSPKTGDAFTTPLKAFAPITGHQPARAATPIATPKNKTSTTPSTGKKARFPEYWDSVDVSHGLKVCISSALTVKPQDDAQYALKY
jgi:hypothetical protein